ncbi:hypothetical protein TH19_22995, partial [Thalassospira profundimaris]
MPSNATRPTQEGILDRAETGFDAVPAIALEPRFMFDAAGAATGAEAAQDAAAQAEAENGSNQGGSDAAASQDADTDIPAAVVGAAGQADRKEVVIVDPGVQDYQTLIAGLGSDVEVILLQQNATIADIASVLDGMSGIDGLHILSHGATGTLNLSGGALTIDTLDANLSALQAIGDALSESGDIVLYGCNVGADGSGQAFLDQLASATGADILASDDATGATALGGDWDLEASSGEVEAGVIFAQASTESYDRVLAAPSIGVTDFSTGDYSGLSSQTETNVGGTGWDFTTTGLMLTFNDTTKSVSALFFGNGGSVTISSNDGSEFKLNSLTVSSGTTGNEGYTITGYKDGVAVTGATANGTLPSPGVFGTINVGSIAAFGNIDSYTITLATGNTFNFDDINISAAVGANAAPTATNLTQNKTYTEGDSSVALDAIVVSDADSGDTITATLTLSNANAGVLTTGTFGSSSSSYNSGTGVWTVTGTVTDVNAALAAVSFTPSSNWDQNVTITTQIRDNSNTGPTNGSIALNVTAVNDAPTATNLTQTQTYTEDDSSVALGDIVVTDVDSNETITATLTLSNSSAGSLTTGTFGSSTSSFSNGVWTVSGSVTDVNAALAAVAFTPVANWDQDVTITTRIRDAADTGPADGTITLDVTAANDAPSVTNGSEASLTATTEDTTSSGTTISSFLSSVSYADVDTSASSGIAITGVTGNGIWQYSTDGTTWTNFGTVSSSAALLLASSSQVRYVPDGNNGETANFTFRGWDQTSGSASTNGSKATADVTSNGGSTAFSANSASAKIVVNSVNDAPTATNLTQNKTYTEDAISVALDPIVVSDADSGDTITATLTLSDSNAGSLTTGTFGSSTSSFSNGVWTVTGTVTDVNAALAAVAFTPAANWDQNITIATQIRDNSSTGPTNGSIALNVTAVNDAPVLSTAASPAINVADTQGAPQNGSTSGSVLVSSLVDIGGSLSNMTDVDGTTTTGVAITGISTTKGSWFYSTDGGTSWTALTSASDAGALLLRSTDRLYFQPSSAGTDASGLTIRAWDQSSGTAGTTVNVSSNGGTTAFSTATDTVSIAVNGQPTLTLDSGNLTFTEGDAATQIFPTGSISDPEANYNGATLSVSISANAAATDGIGLPTGTDSGINVSGTNLRNGTTVIGTVNVSGGSVTSSNTLTLTFNASADQTAVIAALRSLSYSNGSDAPGDASRTVSVTFTDGDSISNSATRTIAVTQVNDAPTASGVPSSVTVTEDTASNVDLSAITISDADAGSGTITVTINASAGTLAATGSGGVTVSGTSSALTLTGTVANIDTYLNTASNIKYTSAANATGANVATLTIKANDGGNTGTGGGSDVTLGTVAVNVTGVNDAPTITDGATVTLTGTNEDTTSGATAVSSILTSASGADVDSGASSGIAITGLTGNGTWQYSTDSGANWHNVGSVSAGSAVLLSSTAQLRYVPDTIKGETATLSFRAWDQTSGTATSGAVKGTADTTTNGGTTAFSSQTASASLVVSNINDAPTANVDTANGGTTVVSVTEDTAGNFRLSDINFGDIDGDNLTVTIVASAGTFGTPASGANVGNGVTATLVDGTTVKLVGSAADINTYLDTTSNIQYTGAANAAGTGVATYTVTTSDGTATAQAIDGTINITGVNDAPTIGGLSGDSVNYTKGETIKLDAGQNALVTDIDSTHFNHGTLTVSIASGGVSGEDILTLVTSGTTITLAGTTAGSQVSVGGT